MLTLEMIEICGELIADKSQSRNVIRMAQTLLTVDSAAERLKNVVAVTEVERDAADKVCDNLRAENAALRAQVERMSEALNSFVKDGHRHAKEDFIYCSKATLEEVAALQP